MNPMPEYPKKIVMAKGANPRHFQLQQCGLSGIGVHSIYTSWFIQRVIENVATSARNCHHTIFRTDSECHPIDCRIFPAGGVNQRARIERIE
jgi:hypothetical protein